MQAALAALLALPPAAYSDEQWAVLRAMLELLPRAAAELLLVFGERGQVDFTGVAQGAVRALGDPDAPTDLLLSLDVRIKHILVDEFQDTSISQWELLERLTAGWQPDDGRTMFAVGDPMQSIYRFREAEVGLFLRARHAGLGGVPLEPLRLTTNFRSQAGIVDWVNRTFPRVLPAAEDETSGAVPYSPSVAHHPAQDGDAVRWHLFEERGAEAQRVVEIARAARAGNAHGSIAILVRNRSHLDHIVPALKQAGLRYRAVEIERLGEKQVVQDLYALTRALAHPADRAAWLAVLRAPWCGLTPVQLAGLAEATRDTVWEAMHDDSRIALLDADAQERLDRVRGVLDTALAERLRGSLRDRVEGAWLALGGPACCEDATDLEDAEIFLEELAAADDAGDLPEHGALDARLSELYALPDMEAGPDAIEIMTVHKAKGLEFDTVIMPGLDRTQRHGEPPLIIWKALADDLLLLAPIPRSRRRQRSRVRIRAQSRTHRGRHRSRAPLLRGGDARGIAAAPFGLHQVRQGWRREDAREAHLARQGLGGRCDACKSVADRTRARRGESRAAAERSNGSPRSSSCRYCLPGRSGRRPRPTRRTTR
jgi:ATP-dependent exoDNAse (exonuclease V) beta subunit